MDWSFQIWHSLFIPIWQKCNRMLKCKAAMIAPKWNLVEQLQTILFELETLLMSKSNIANTFLNIKIENYACRAQNTGLIISSIIMWQLGFQSFYSNHYKLENGFYTSLESSPLLGTLFAESLRKEAEAIVSKLFIAISSWEFFLQSATNSKVFLDER